MKDRLAKSVFWVVWSRGVIQLISLFATLVVARLLSPEDYGLMALASVWTSTISVASEMGLGLAIVQFRDLKECELNACFWSIIVVSVLGYLGLFAIASAIAQWFASPALASVLRFAGLSLLFAAVRVVPDSLLRQRLELKKVSQAEIIAVVSSIAITLGLAWAGAGIWALVSGILVMSFVQSLATIWFVQWWPGFHVGGERMREILRFGFATLGSRLCFSLYQQTDTIVLGKTSGEVAVGLYSMAKELATLPANKVSSVMGQLASPVMSELQTDREAMRASLLRAIRLVAWVTFPLSIGVLLVAQDFVQVALTAKWMDMVPLIQLLCLYAMVRSVDALLPWVLYARYRANFVFGNTVMLLVVMPLAFWAGAVWSGALGVSVAWVVVYPVLIVRIAREALREVRVTWKSFWIQLWPPLAATSVMLATVLVIRWGMFDWGSHVGTVRLLVMSLSGALTYVLCLWRFGGPVRNEIREVVCWTLGRGSVAVKAPS